MSVPTMMCVAHAGGQGKTTLTQLLYLAKKADGTSPELASADFLDARGKSKLGKLYSNAVEEFGIGAKLTDARTENNPNAPLRYWDKLGHVFVDGNYIVDMGANVITRLLEWTQDRRLADLLERRNAPKIDFFCVCKAERHALDDILGLCEEILEQDRLINRIVLVENEVLGSFGEIENRIQDFKFTAGAKATTMTLPKCQSELWPQMEKHCVSIESVLEMSEDDLCDTLGVDIWTANAGLTELQHWFEDVKDRLRKIDVIKAGTPAARSSADKKSQQKAAS